MKLWPCSASSGLSATVSWFRWIVRWLPLESQPKSEGTEWIEGDAEGDGARWPEEG